MMSYHDCQQRGCWIVQFFRLSKLPLPRFFITQRVVCDYFDEEDNFERSTGAVVGLVYKAPGLSRRVYVPGWYCLVRWDDTKVTRTTMTYVEVHELELSAEEESDL